MSEISIVLVTVVALAVAYLYVYPNYAGDDVRKLAWLDVAVGAITLAILAPFNWNAPAEFTFFVFDTNWWIFAILTYSLLEVPLFYGYVKARGLGRAYRAMFTVGGGFNGFTEMASEKSVHKQLADTKWDGLRTRGALRFLVFGANLTMLVGTAFLFVVGDNDWAALSILYIVILMIFWILLRTAVRLIPDAPDAALDERLLQERNSVYFRAYQVLGSISATLVTALLGYAIGSDLRGDGEGFNGFNYSIDLTWPQINAIFWLIFGYAYMLPSIIMAWRESKRLAVG